MNYLKEYNITQEEIKELKDRFNENIIKFLEENEMFIKEKLDYLKEQNFIIYPILKDNIKIFLEMDFVLKRKIENMKNKNFNNKQIQMILMNEKLYNEF